jgi:tRNA(Ile)-lysidine synthase
VGAMGFRFTHPLPEKCMVAVSGGVDSMSALHFLSQVEGRIKRVIHVNHDTGDFAEDAEALVRKVCEEQRLGLTVRRITDNVDEGESKENFWREQRYQFFKEEWVNHHAPIVLAHTLEDCFEEYIICTMIRGYSGTIPYRRACCIRPFRLWHRDEIEDYARRHSLRWITDPSNLDTTKFLRAKLRRLITPRIRFINPGVYKIVEKVIREQDERDEN